MNELEISELIQNVLNLRFSEMGRTDYRITLSDDKTVIYLTYMAESKVKTIKIKVEEYKP